MANKKGLFKRLEKSERVIHVWSENGFCRQVYSKAEQIQPQKEEMQLNVNNSSAAELNTKIVDMQHKSLFVQIQTRHSSVTRAHANEEWH